MKIRNHPKIKLGSWPPSPGGTNVTAEHPQSESQPIISEVHVDSVRGTAIPLSGAFKGNVFTYDVQTEDHSFALQLAKEFSKHCGKTLQQLGDLDVDF